MLLTAVTNVKFRIVLKEAVVTYLNYYTSIVMLI
jgi:hypothetical protein